MSDQKIAFGKTVTDSITGFAGVVTGFCTYITGCNQYLVVPKVDEKGGFRDPHWFDEDRLTVRQEEAPVTLGRRTSPGADMPAPIK